MSAQPGQERAEPPAADSAQAIGHPWTRPPEPPMPYGLVARFSDMFHGWLDGRRGIPRLPEVKPVNGAAVPSADEHTKPLPPEVGETAAETALPWLETPRMKVLSWQALERIHNEEIACLTDCAVRKEELKKFLRDRDAAAQQVARAKNKLEQAQRPLSADERETRRLAEEDRRKRPEALVRARRDTAWERRLRDAEQAYLAAIARLAEATRQAEAREEFIRDRTAVARAAALRHHELAMRRIATYLQQLVRRHRQGPDLNLLLVRYPAGPDLPEWTRDPEADIPDDPSPIGRQTGRRRSHVGNGTGGAHVSEETSSR